jgi:hypothetical protein
VRALSSSLSFSLFRADVASLTAILSQPPEFVQTFNGIGDVVDARASFCVQAGAANDAYFTNHPKRRDRVGPLIERKSSVPEQVDSVLDGSCDSAEITREDVSQWTKTHSEQDRCRMKLSSVRLTRRSRGMMALPSQACVIKSIDTTYHAFSVRQCDGLDPPAVCDSLDLTDLLFPETTCEHQFDGTNDDLSLGLENLIGMYVVLGLLTFLGSVASCLGRRHQQSPIPLVRHLMESPEAMSIKMHMKDKERMTSIAGPLAQAF